MGGGGDIIYILHLVKHFPYKIIFFMQINRKHQVKTMFTDKSLHENDYSMEKNNLQGGGTIDQGFSMKEKYSKVMLWWKGYYLNK